MDTLNLLRHFIATKMRPFLRVFSSLKSPSSLGYVDFNEEKKISLIGIGIGILTLCGALFLYERATDGFNFRQIASSLSSDFFLETKGDKKKIFSLFDKPFYYLGKGCQTYVFESEDRKYVIKFFKQKHLRSLNWLRKLPLSSSWVEEKILKRERRIRDIFSSCQIAYEKLGNESGVIFVHLNKEPCWGRHIVLKNKLGFPVIIYLDDFQFIIQKKGIPLSEILKYSKDEKELGKKIDQVCHLLTERMHLGISDRDPSVAKNMAFTCEENQPLFIDVGQFYLDVKKTEEEIRKELLSRLQDVSIWADKHAPHAVALIEKKMNQISH